MRRLVAVTMVVAVAALGAPLRADDKADPSGTWKWMTGRQGNQREMTIKIKLEGDKLSGAIVDSDGKEIPLEDATWKDGEVSFKLTRERNGQKSSTKYSGKVNGDTIKGKIETERNGQPRSRDWEAKRAKG